MEEQRAKDLYEQLKHMPQSDFVALAKTAKDENEKDFWYRIANFFLKCECEELVKERGLGE